MCVVMVVVVVVVGRDAVMPAAVVLLRGACTKGAWLCADRMLAVC